MWISNFGNSLEENYKAIWIKQNIRIISINYTSYTTFFRKLAFLMNTFSFLNLKTNKQTKKLQFSKWKSNGMTQKLDQILKSCWRLELPKNLKRKKHHQRGISFCRDKREINHFAKSIQLDLKWESLKLPTQAIKEYKINLQFERWKKNTEQASRPLNFTLLSCSLPDKLGNCLLLQRKFDESSTLSNLNTR